MLRRILNMLVPPVRDELERGLMVTALNLVLWTSTVIWAGLATYYLAQGKFDGTVKSGIPIVALLLISLLLVRRGHLTFPRVAYPVIMAVIVPYLAAGDQGLHDNVILGYPFLVLMGGLFLGRAGAVLFGVVAYVDVLILYWMEKAGAISSISSKATEWTDLFDIAVLLTGCVALLWAIMSTMSQIALKVRISEAKIRDSRNMLAHVLDSVPQGVYWKDAEGTYLGCNDVFAHTAGLKNPEEIVGLSDSDLPELRVTEAERAADREVIESVRPTRHVVEAKQLSDGRTVWIDTTRVPLIDERGLVNGVLGVAEDITERRRAEEQLRERNETISAMVETSQDWIWSVDCHGIHTYSNPAIELILGYTPEELVGRPSLVLVHEEDRARAEQQMLAAIEHKSGWRNLLARWRHKDGTWRYLESNAVAIVSSDGELVGFRGVDRDVTERRQLQEQLLQSQKMEAIGQLAGGVAHDFNNLLQAILGYADLLLFKLGEEDPNRREVDQVRLAADKATTLTRRLLAFSRRQIIQPAPMDLNEVVAGLMKMVQRLIGEHIQLEIIPCHLLETICADQGQIEQVLMNLCVNARDAMPEGGTLRIETDHVSFDDAYVRMHPWAREGRFVLLRVTDTGCGMTRDTMDHIFEPFFTTKKVGEGTGLGLSMVYGIVQQHDGMIRVTSAEGKGTTFHVYLPITSQTEPGTVREPFVPPPCGTECVLVVEDDAPIRELAASVLETAGYTVLTAPDGVDAMVLLNARTGPVDLLLVDVVMPHMGGYELLKHVRKVRPDAKFLFTSGYSPDAVHTNFIIKQGLHLLQKPYSRDTLLRKIREILDGRATVSDLS